MCIKMHDMAIWSASPSLRFEPKCYNTASCPTLVSSPTPTQILSLMIAYSLSPALLSVSAVANVDCHTSNLDLN